MNPYENAFDFGDVSFAGDPTPCKRKLSELPQPPFNYCTSEAEGNTSVINEPRPGPSQSQLPPPRSMNELYKRRFRRPYITEEGYNLDDYRDEKAPMPTDPGYLASKKDILKHRDMIRNKFSTMQSANNITHMLYFEQPLDPKRAISGTYPYENISKYSAIFEQYENNIGDTSFERESALETSFSMDMSRYPFYKM
ncbi:hypothetical protein TYRP_001249 [Tyrophagus putrescentiae]|nr:hypothetical protein TYRP_001249 [Tyrophagus putrescentiae]